MSSPVIAKFMAQSKFHRMDCENKVIILLLACYVVHVYFILTLGPLALE